MLVSNDHGVQQWFGRLAWVLVLHSQSRISCLNAQSLLIPLGKGKLKVISTAVSFYLIASPIAGVVALTDFATSSVVIKMVACVGASSVAQTVLAFYCFAFLNRLNWDEAAELINRRANMDREMVAAPGTCSASVENHERLEGGKPSWPMSTE